MCSKPKAMTWSGVVALISLMVVATTPSLAWASSSGEPAPRWPMLLAGVVLVAGGLALMTLRGAWFELSSRAKLWRVVGVLLAGVGFYGVLFGATEPPPGGERVVWMSSYTEARELAQERGVPLMIDFTADWCLACGELEREVFEHPSVRQRLEQEIVALKIDYDAGDAETIAAIERFEVSGLPRVAFEGADGTYLRGASFEGKLSVDEFLARLDAALEGQDAQSEGWLQSTLDERGLWAVFLLVFGAGILSSFAPCVYPLIPITIGVFGARQAASRREAFLLSLTYVSGIVLTYSALGVIAASLGTVFGGFLQHPMVQLGIAGLFVALGLGTLGAWDMRLPGGLQTRLGQAGGAGFAGAFVMGLVAGAIAAPCIGPVVAGILVYVAQQGDLVLGWSLLSAFALGLGLLFLVLGTFSGLIQKLPRAGGWMEGSKAVFSAVFFGLAIFYARLALPVLVIASERVWLALASPLLH
ncbi:hypothetical protein DL240_04865 [Lujinxingia litoralis]|uniref:Thioredoxin domain-containing protein n=1 Tax=Lujinxingia litoralis TaxID=2211119 RepID=A0A328C827_9DELT|nr:cytochrome c biogenesis protein CcdA [Lujinxingia litoralis]RAL23496.1 hypothetical protein DL240_04865 [Lujinxingia litoralis]